MLSEVDVDWIIFSEPIGGNDGPLLSPRQYEEFVLSGYRPALDVARRRGVARHLPGDLRQRARPPARAS